MIAFGAAFVICIGQVILTIVWYRQKSFFEGQYNIPMVSQQGTNDVLPLQERQRYLEQKWSMLADIHANDRGVIEQLQALHAVCSKDVQLVAYTHSKKEYHITLEGNSIDNAFATLASKNVFDNPHIVSLAQQDKGLLRAHIRSTNKLSPTV